LKSVVRGSQAQTEKLLFVLSKTKHFVLEFPYDQYKTTYFDETISILLQSALLYFSNRSMNSSETMSDTIKV